jgi:uncharacterized protein
MHQAIQQFGAMLRSLDNCIVKAETYATAKKFDVNNLANSRLAPDMYNFAKQVQSTCDAAKFSASYLTGKEAPPHPDTETTIPELRTRIQSCINFLETCSEKDFEGWADRKVSPRWLGGKWLTGQNYLHQAGFPNFYFHLTTAYAILRHNGGDVGKTDFMGPLTTQG